MGQGRSKKYYGGQSIWFDNIDKNTWSPPDVDDLIEQIGYEKEGRMTVYYCMPGLQVNTNGLRVINGEDATDNMRAFVTFGHHFMDIFLEHDDSIRDLDDVVRFPIQDLPKVISPMKPLNVVRPESGEGFRTATEVLKEKGKSVINMDADDVHDNDASGGSTDSEEEGSDIDYVPEIADSDYAISEGDDDLYVNNCFDAVEENRNEEQLDVSEDDELRRPDSDDEGIIEMNFKTFRDEDLISPKFHVGQVFQNVQLLRKAIKEYSCRNRVNLKMPTNDKMRVCAKCEEGCPWYLWASNDNRTKAFMVKKLVDKHTCSKKWQVKSFTDPYMAEKYLDSFRADENMSMKNFSRVVQEQWNMKPSRSKLRRAKRLALNIVHGDEEKQYNKLWDYANEWRRSNPGSTFYLAADTDGTFLHCYFSLEPCKRGFMQACRLVIFLDGCHLKTRYGGVLLTAVGLDPNDCIYPIACAIVDIENTDAWRWFLSSLKQDLLITDTDLWTIMSDKQKVLS